MNELIGGQGPTLDFLKVKEVIELRDTQVVNEYTKDAQIMGIDNARKYWPDKYGRAVKLTGSSTRAMDL